MLSSTLSAVAMMAMGAFALPTPMAAPAESTGSTYTVHIQNKCSTTKHFATFQIQQPSFVMNQLSKVTSLEAGKNGTITIPVEATGVRLSAKGDQGVAAQWAAQPLVEFGYSDFTYAGAVIKSISYDLSMMETGVLGDGLSVCPTACPNQCKSKLANAVADIKQAWTNADQVADGSPADTLCSAPNGGVTDFEVVWNACS